MEKDTRPLSPHLQVYKWSITMLTSILHRVTGIASAVGLVLVTIWLALASMGENGLRMANALFHNSVIVLGMFIWSACLIYHLCNGIRHLVWDVGKGFEKHHAQKSARFVLTATAVLTLALWIGIWAVL